MAYMDWIKVGGISETRPKNAEKEGIHRALVRMSLAVAAMGKSDPASPDWGKLSKDFDKAAKDVRQAVRRYDREWRGPSR
jgi:hypothetical protein